MAPIEAVYQNGVFKPLTPVALPENQTVRLCIEPVATADVRTWLADVTVTESTLEVTAEASGLLENALIAVVKSEPFCSNWTRLLFGVEGLKKASQLAVICATAPAGHAMARCLRCFFYAR